MQLIKSIGLGICVLFGIIFIGLVCSNAFITNLTPIGRLFMLFISMSYFWFALEALCNSLTKFQKNI